jgi:hypothetical protein
LLLLFFLLEYELAAFPLIEVCQLWEATLKLLEEMKD